MGVYTLSIWNEEKQQYEGIPALKGDTPIRGEDYWTEDDVAEIKAYIDTQLGVVENGTY